MIFKNYFVLQFPFQLPFPFQFQMADVDVRKGVAVNEGSQIHLSIPTDLSHCCCPEYLDIPDNNYAVIHGKYIYNLCRQQADHHIDLIVEELISADKYKMDLIIHQGKNIESEGLTRMGALNNYINGIKRVLEETNHLCLENRLVLENSAKQGNELGYSIDELVYILEQIDDPRVAICIDTCHAFVAGVCDFRQVSEVNAFVKRIRDEIGIDRLAVIHLNDSRVAFNKCNDHHGDFYAGYITNPDLGGCIEGIQLFIEQLIINDKIPYVYETPCDIVPIEFQRNIVKSGSFNNDQIKTYNLLGKSKYMGSKSK